MTENPTRRRRVRRRLPGLGRPRHRRLPHRHGQARQLRVLGEVDRPRSSTTPTSKGKDDFFMFGEVYDADAAKLSPVRAQDRHELGARLRLPVRGRELRERQQRAAACPTLFASDDMYTTPDSSASALPTFLGNHDMGRIGYLLQATDDAQRRDELAHDLMYLTRGQPVVYYGDEQGFAGAGGGKDKDARQSLFATQVDEYANQPLVTGEQAGSVGPLRHRRAALHAHRRARRAARRPPRARHRRPDRALRRRRRGRLRVLARGPRREGRAPRRGEQLGRGQDGQLRPRSRPARRSRRSTVAATRSRPAPTARSRSRSRPSARSCSRRTAPWASSRRGTSRWPYRPRRARPHRASPRSPPTSTTPRGPRPASPGASSGRTSGSGSAPPRTPRRASSTT